VEGRGCAGLAGHARYDTVLSAWRVDHAPADVRWVAAKNSNRQAKRKMAEAKKLHVDPLKSNSSSAQRD
jgi:hypothetical protein